MDTSKPTLTEKVAYGAGDFAFCLYWQMFSMFLLFFYTDIFGISAAAAGTMFLVTRLWDTANDPLMGIITDRTTTRWGKFRPYLLWLAIPLSLTAVVTFSTPDFSTTGKIIYAYVTYGLLMMVYTALNVPYAALLGVITDDPDEKTAFASARVMGAYLGGTFVQLATFYLVAFIGQGNQKLGYQGAVVVYSSLAAILLLTTFYFTKERVKPKATSSAVSRDIADLVRNIPWIILGIVGVTIFISLSIRAGTILYYFKYYVENEGLSPWYMGIGSVASLISMLFLKPFTQVVGKRTGLVILLSGYAVTSGLLYYIAASQTALIFAGYIAVCVFLGPIVPLLWSMYADTADYSEWKHGRRATGLLFSASSASQKLGWALAGTVTAWLLAAFGFTANVDQSPESLFGIKMLMSYIPGSLAIVGIAAALCYRLDTAMVHQITTELAERRAAEEQEQAAADAASSETLIAEPT